MPSPMPSITRESRSAPFASCCSTMASFISPCWVNVTALLNSCLSNMRTMPGLSSACCSHGPVWCHHPDLLFEAKVRHKLKTPYRDGITHVFFELLDFIARLVALVTPGKRGKDKKTAEEGCSQKKIAERRKAKTWLQHLKRVFNIDIEKCEHCGGHVICHTSKTLLL